VFALLAYLDVFRKTRLGIRSIRGQDEKKMAAGKKTTRPPAVHLIRRPRCPRRVAVVRSPPGPLTL
jgi:hypothetical protein